MDTMAAFAIAQQARGLGLEPKVFDWIKAAEFIRDHRDEIVWVNAGLKEDMEWTSGEIWNDDSVVSADDMYLKSIWATPIMEVLYKNDAIGMQTIECWQYAKDSPWNEYTV